MNLRYILKRAYEAARAKNDHLAMIEIAKIMVQKNIHNLDDENVPEIGEKK